MKQLKYLSDKALEKLRTDVGENIDRYLTSGFADLADNPAWDIPLGFDYDAKKLATLDLSQPRNIASIDLINSKIVGEALANLTPSAANEERVWVHLSHVETIDYCRARWLSGAAPERHEALIVDHFFAPTQTGVRDDHAISRLWWNYQIAKTCMPEDIDRALDLILTTADVRSNFVERIWMTSRRRIAGAVLRAMKSNTSVTGSEKNFREFMKALNRLGGGIVFEALSDAETDAFVAECIKYAELEEAA
ncbi:hypothetical protein IE4872_CH00491 [Rhizobium gallicum]|uniref:Uncharacterized protein n=1 Tax=Rhizobium gallicum TaxID=56730 RepID=A0A1L5NE34_9HYPH|nr:DUF6339 family protein [Rhizobium gallicum]APO66156.1 hypothetical protein IE4872_CH00491 [Rhizobium gallicum]